MMKYGEILEELWAIRRDIEAENNHDFQKIIQSIRRKNRISASRYYYGHPLPLGTTTKKQAA